MLVFFLYAAAAAFIAGNLYRVVRILRMPAHLRWELYPMPGPGSYFEQPEWWTRPAGHPWGSQLAYIAGEVFGFATLWKRNRPMWLWSWLLHMGLFALVAAIGFTFLGAFWLATFQGALRLAIAIVACAGIPGTLGLLTVRQRRLRGVSSRADIFNLLLIASVFATAAAALLLDTRFPEAMSVLAGALLGMNPAPELGLAATAHVVVLGLFLAYFPATHMTHAYMKFFAFHRVRWDDAAVAHRPSMARAMARNLERPISWAAPHIGKQNWAAAVAGSDDEVRR